MSEFNHYSSKRVVVNTAVLYIRLLVVMVIGLFTTRLVLAALGEVDYGIYALVAGVIGMLAFLQGAMSSASMRFLAHGLGSGNKESQLKTFNTTLFLHFGLALLLLIIIEIGGIIMFKYYLNIPEARVLDAKIVFHFMVITTFVSVISVPFDAVINSHENMTFLSIVDILGSIMKLGVAIYLTFSNANLLIIYGLMMLIIQIALRIIKQRYSQNKYPECKINFRRHVKKSYIKSILSFSGWTLIGSISSMLVGQFKSVLLNMFFGVRLNATQGIAQTVSGQVNTVSNSMTSAIRPQLIKSEGGGDRAKMLMLTNAATKFSMFLFALFAIPVLVELPYLLRLWLTIVPDYTVIFCRLILIGLFMEKMSFEIGTAIVATGNIKSMTIVESSTIIVSVIGSYLLFKLGYPPYSLYIVGILFGFVIFVERLYFGKIIAGLNVRNFILTALIPVMIPVVIAAIFAFISYLSLPEGWLRLFVTAFVALVGLTVSFRYIGLTVNEYEKLRAMLYAAIDKLKKVFHIS